MEQMSMRETSNLYTHFRNGQTPLYYAATFHYEEIVKLLITAKATVDEM